MFIIWGILLYWESHAAPVRVATYNLLNKNAPHALLYPSWGKRSQAIADWVHRDQIDILATQEGVDSMLEDLRTALPNFDRVGQPRSNSWFFAEYAAIFFNRDRFAGLQSGDFWLSETPDVPGSRSWGAMNVRLCSWIKLREHATGLEFYVFNVHFDHFSKRAREESARLVLQRIPLIAGSSPIVLAGDFNTGDGERSLELLRERFTEAQSPSEGSYAFGWNLDHIFTSGWKPCAARLAQPTTPRGHSCSDHKPVVADLEVLP